MTFGSPSSSASVAATGGKTGFFAVGLGKSSTTTLGLTNPNKRSLRALKFPLVRSSNWRLNASSTTARASSFLPCFSKIMAWRT